MYDSNCLGFILDYTQECSRLNTWFYVRESLIEVLRSHAMPRFQHGMVIWKAHSSVPSSGPSLALPDSNYSGILFLESLKGSSQFEQLAAHKIFHNLEAFHFQFKSAPFNSPLPVSLVSFDFISSTHFSSPIFYYL